MPAAGSSVQPCRSASSIACLLRSAARANDRETSIAAWCARPVNSRYGRPIRRASATPCSRCRSRLLEPGRPVLGDAEVDQRQRAQVLAQAGLRRVRGLGHGLQPPRLLGHRRQVAALAGQQQPDHPEQHLHLPAPAGRHRRRSPLRQRQVPLRLLQRPLRQLIGRGQRRQLGIGRAGLGGEPGQQLVDGGGLPVQVQAGPVIGEQPGGQPPVPRRLGVPDRLHREPVPGEPPGGGPVQPGDLTRRGAPQLQLQQAGEQLVVAEPGPRRVQRHHERVRLLQVLQDPLPALTPGQQRRPARR